MTTVTEHSANSSVQAHSSRYLQVQDLAALQNVVFAPRRPIRGLYAGRHASRQRGHCVEFNDYREYAPGDEVGDIDWKVFGRSDRLFIKLFEHQTDMTVGLLVDASASMDFAGLGPKQQVERTRSWFGPRNMLGQKRDANSNGKITTNPSKYDQACLMAAAIAFLTIRQQDRLSFGLAQDGLKICLDARGGFMHLNHMLNLMESARQVGRARLADALHSFTRRLPRRSLLILLSDLMETQEPIIRSLNEFTSVGGEVIVFQVLHQDELKLPDMDEAVFVDSETDQHLKLNVPDIRSSYESRIRESTENWRRALTARGMSYHLASTATHYHEAIRDYLFTRAARA